MQLAVAPRRSSVEWAVVSTVIAGALLLALAALLVGVGPLVANLRTLGPMFGLFVLLMFWQVGCRFLRWFFLARCLGVTLAPPEAALYYGAGLGMALTPARIGEMLRLWFIQKRVGIPYRRLAALYVADRAGDASAYLVMLAVATGLRGQGALMTWGPLLVMVAFITAILHPRPFLELMAFGYRLTRRLKRPLVWLRRLIRNTSALFRPMVFLPALAVGVAGWCAAPLVLTLALSRLGIDFDPFYAAAIYAASALTGGATMLPGGGGGTEVAMVALLLAAGVPLDAAVTATVATRITFLWLPVGLGLLVLPVALGRVRRLAAA